ncbi:hypothetical protein FKM82_029926 [Ascaphus truei]
MRFFCLNTLFGFRQTERFSSRLKSSTFDLSVQRTLFQKSCGSSMCSFANFRWTAMFFLESSDFPPGYPPMNAILVHSFSDS